MSPARKHDRYQDYVIKNGVHVGEYEQMYRDFEDPWHQATLERDAIDKAIGCKLLQQHGHVRALEYGCGLGQYTDQLQSALGAAAGIDISETAILKARERYPNSVFYTGDITDTRPIIEFKPDVLVFSQVTWYLLDRLADFKAVLRKHRVPGFLHLLHVYPEGEQKYGSEFFTNLDGIRRYWSDVIDIENWGIISRKEDAGGGRTFFYGTVK